jgi:hypothetical protein
MDVSGIGGGVSAFSIAQTQKDTSNAQLVTKTLDTMNGNQDGAENADYSFQKSVLQAGVTGKGTQINKLA